MSFDLKRLYNLLPAMYRIRDTEQGIAMLTPEEKVEIETLSGLQDDVISGPLKSLLTIIAEQVAVLEENLEQLYDDQFIETCAEWAVTYIGQLVGTRGLIQIPDAPFSQRAQVANTISYRRRKGTASVIEQLARDVTGWNANVVEYFQLLATTQYMNHTRPENRSVSSVRNGELLEYANTPFDKMAHNVDVRSIEKKRGKYNIQNLGIFLWRLNSYSLTKSPAYKVDDRRYTFNALGKNTRLYNLPVTEEEITHLAEPVNVPMPISRQVLYRNLETYYGHDTEGKDKSILVYADGNAVAPANGSATKLADLISVCDLSDVFDGGGKLTGWAHMPADKIAIDPILGRIAFPASQPPPRKVHATYYYGFSADMGGGEYDRAATFTNKGKKIIEVQSGKVTIQEALQQLAVTGGVVEIIDNEYYLETPVIRIAKGKSIELRAANQLRPVWVLGGEMLVFAEENASLIINGILISGGSIRVPLMYSPNQLNKLQLLRIEHCTLLPGSSAAFDNIPAQPMSPRVVVSAADTVIEIDKCITGGLRIFEGAKTFISNSIVDASRESAIAYAGLSDEQPGGALNISGTTVIGKVRAQIMQLASNSIFIAGGFTSYTWPAAVMAQRLQQGCVRFSYIPPGAKLPRPYRCQPSDPLTAARLRPIFTSLRYNDAGYCQLTTRCAVEITQGADDEAEMGAFHHLYQPQREVNLRTRLDEYLRFGLEAGIFYAS